MLAAIDNPPDEDSESIIRPGITVSSLPQPLPGRLVMVQTTGGLGYSDVYRGYWTLEGEQDVSVAIKRLRRVRLGAEEGEEEWARRIKREVTIWRAAVHENILPFIGYQIVDGDAMLVSPWCENGNLGRFIRIHPDLSDVTKLRLLNGAARGLAYLHSLEPPIIHGDIAPNNVMVTDDIKAVLCDVGISRVMTSLRQHNGLIIGGSEDQTTAYLARELLIGDGSWPTKSSDVYAFGGVILVAMSGKAPLYQLAKRSRIAITLAVAQGQTASPFDHPELPASDPLWDLLRGCWFADPSERLPVTEVIYMVSLLGK
ncbi:hypothetical protein FRC04_001720 [Tulasnella sp. 424]|nr:hypothetical protein FRC04_001720 [Tulasnella sp. 424]